MGHIHLAILPKTKNWKAVIDLLVEGKSDVQVVAASIRAAEHDLSRIPVDRVFIDAVHLLAMIPLAATGEAFGERLRQLGLTVEDRPGLPDLVVAIGDRLNRTLATHTAGADSSQLIRQAFLGTMTTAISPRVPGQFAATPEEVQDATARLARQAALPPLACNFLARVFSSVLGYFLDRKLSTLVGPGSRFADVGERQAFNRFLDQHCLEASGVVSEFCNAWYVRTVQREGEISAQRAAEFGALAFRKIREELQDQGHLYA